VWNNGCEISIVLESVHLSNFGNCVHSCRKEQRAGWGTLRRVGTGEHKAQNKGKITSFAGITQEAQKV